MRLGLSFAGACVMAFLLFALMLYMVTPPRTEQNQDPVRVASFIPMDNKSGESSSRQRQQAPQPPQPQTQPQTQPTQAAPAATAMPNVPSLNIELPSIAGNISLNAAAAPSLSGLAAGAASAVAASAPAGGGESGGGQMGGIESEVMPLNDVRPEYPGDARRRGIEGHVKIAFTITRAGQVENVRVLEASPRNVFDRSARRAAARWRFAPRTENGLAVDREAVKTLYFRLERE